MLSRDTGHDLVTDWRSRARCRDVDPEIFFPIAESGHLLDAQVAEARAVCAGCPVVEQCLEYARECLPYGIAGGQTPAERRRNGRSCLRAPGRPTDKRRSETAEAGRKALRAGRRPVDVARDFGVSERTVYRWASAEQSAAAAPATAGRGVA